VGGWFGVPPTGGGIWRGSGVVLTRVDSPDRFWGVVWPALVVNLLGVSGWWDGGYIEYSLIWNRFLR